MPCRSSWDLSRTQYPHHVVVKSVTSAVSATLATTRSIARLFLAATQSGDVPAGTSPSSTLARHLAASNSSFKISNSLRGF
jgi:hypothetical protein